MKIRNGNTPITNLPIIKAGDPITARWANSVTRAIEELKRRTPVLTGVSPRKQQPKRLPFEVFTRGKNLVAAAGNLDGVPIDEITEEDPADGMWYFEVAVTIDGDDGTVLTREAQWTQSTTTPTGTVDALTIGQIEVVGGYPTAESITNFNYGPILVSIYGGITARWNIEIF